MHSVLIGIGLIGGLTLYAAIGVVAVRKLLHGKVREGHNDTLVPLFLTAGVLYAVLLGFLVIAIWESYDKAKDTVATEAAAMVPLYRSTNGMPGDVGPKMRVLARNYVEAVIEDEWETQAETGQASSKARHASGMMFRAFGDGTITQQDKKDYPFIFTAFMNAVNEVSNLRNQRNIMANESIPLAMWIAVIGGALVVIGMCFMIFMEIGWPHVVMAGLMAALIGSLLFISYIFSHPFNGPMAISPEAFENTMKVFDDIDQGN